MSLADVNWEGVAVVVTALLGSGGIAKVMNERRPKDAPAHALIDQYQERVGEQDGKISTLETRINGLVAREEIRDDYIMILRQHIADGKPPPPPPFPQGLIGGGH